MRWVVLLLVTWSGVAGARCVWRFDCTNGPCRQVPVCEGPNDWVTGGAATAPGTADSDADGAPGAGANGPARWGDVVCAAVLLWDGGVPVADRVPMIDQENLIPLVGLEGSF